MSEAPTQRANIDSNNCIPSKSNRSNRNDSSDGEDEPWDQRQRVDGDGHAASRQRVYEYYPRYSGNMRSRIFIDDEANLDEGDLPSLSSRVIRKVTHDNIQTATPASNQLATRIPANDVAFVPVTPSPQHIGHRQPTWKTTDKSESRPIQQRAANSGYTEEESGPHDEMAARRLYRADRLKPAEKPSRRTSRRRKGGYTSDSEDSTEYINRSTETFETESFDEDDRTDRSREVEEDYDRTFCGQTLNALNDFCGTLGATANSPTKARIIVEQNNGQSESVKKSSPLIPESLSASKKVYRETAAGIVPVYSQVVHDRTEDNLSANNSLSERNQIFRRVETEQENTAIEVEFVESNDLPVDRKNAYLTKLAKKAKDEYDEKFKERQKIERTQSTDSNNENPKSLEQTIPLNRTGSEAKSEASAKSEEDIYNSMNAAEKRKFLKYINSGYSPYEANMRILSERREKPRDNKNASQSQTSTMLKPVVSDNAEIPRSNNTVLKTETIAPKEQKKELTATNHSAKSKVMERAKEAAKRFSVWKKAGRSTDSDENSNPKSPLLKTESNDSALATTKDATEAAKVEEKTVEILPSIEIDESEKPAFKNSGISYYDGTTRDNVNDENEKLPPVNMRYNPTKSVTKDRFKTLQATAHSSKGKGFEELKGSNTDDDKSQHKPSILQTVSKPPSDANHQETEAAPGAEVGVVEDSMPTSKNEDHAVLLIQVDANQQLAAAVSVDTMDDDVDSRTAEAGIPLSIIHYPVDQRFAHLEDEPPSDEDVLKSMPVQNEVLLKQQTLEQSKTVIQPNTSLSKGTNENLENFTPRHVPMDLVASGEESVKHQDSALIDESKPENDGVKNVGMQHFSASETNNPKRALTTPENNSAGADRDKKFDMSINAYFSATAAMSPIVSGSRDGMSVYTIGTNVTGGSTYSHSTRTRRPGAAKARLAKQKEAETQLGKKTGWHDSIKAAAASTNRLWDPKKGWIDFHDPDSEVMHQSFDSAKEKMHLDLGKSLLSAKRNDEHDDKEIPHPLSADVGIIVPFPPEWEKERLAMLDSSAEHSLLLNLSKITERSSSMTMESSSATALNSFDNSKPKGWVESMKAASAAMGKSGMKWDPVYGWTTIDPIRNRVEEFDEYDDRDRSMISTKSPTRDHNDLAQEQRVDAKVTEPGAENPLSTTTSQTDSKSAMSSMSGTTSMSKDWVTSMKAASAVVVKSGMKWDPVYGWTKTKHVYENEPTVKAGTTVDSKNLVASLASDNEVQGNSAISTPQLAGTALVADTTNGASLDKVEMDRLQMIEEKEGFAMVCVSPNSSLLHQSGGVQFPPNTVMGDHGNILFDDEGNEIPAIEDVLSSSIVDVVKERVGEEDLELFEEPIVRDNASRRVGSFESATIQTPGGSTFSDPNSKDSSARRGTGPVDVDEVDETWDSDDDKRHSTGWDERNGNLPTKSLNGAIHLKSLAIEENHLKGWKDRSPPLDSSRLSVSMLSSDIDESRTENERKWEIRDYGLSHSGNADSRSVVSSSTKSTRASLSKKVPKLERSKYDTSPISRGSTVNEIFPGQSSARSNKPRTDSENVVLTLVDEKKEDRVHFDSGLMIPALGTPEPFHRIKVDNTDKTAAITVAGSVERVNMYKSGDVRNYPVDGRIGHRDEDFSASPSVKDRLQEWEYRIERSLSEDADDRRSMSQNKEQQHIKESAEWRSFLGKKVKEENEAAVRQYQLITQNIETGNMDNDRMDDDRGDARISKTDDSLAAKEDEDSIFQFHEEKGIRMNATSGKEYSKSLDDISDLSPIHHRDDSIDNDPAVSEAYGPREDERGISSFFQRLSACAAPMMPTVGTTTEGANTQSQNIGFLRSIPQSAAAMTASRFVSSSLACGNPEVNLDDDKTNRTSIEAEEHAKRRLSSGDDKPRAISAPRTVISSVSSVASDDFGAKTAYLEALAMRTAVSNPKRRHSASSSVASGGTDSSEKWRAFLERKRAASSSRDKINRTNSHSDVSRAAEKYAAEKVEEIMLKMSSRSNSAPKSRHYSLDIDKLLDTNDEQYHSSGERRIARKRGSSVRAAEDLAAARVEAMMAALSSHHLDEGQI